MKTLQIFHIIFIIIIALQKYCKCAPSIDSTDGFMADEKIIDINNPDQQDMREFELMNINLTALREQQQHLKNRLIMNGDNYPSSDSASPSNNLEPVAMTLNDQNNSARKQ